MSFEQYYQDELAYLREMGAVFADAYPKLAPFLAQKGQDPDVERLLEGFAFMSGKIRQKLDDELPELTHSLHTLLWPNYLRPIPAMSILQFSPINNAITEKKYIRKGVEVDSVPVDGTVCRFRTCYDVNLYPMSLSGITLDDRGTSSEIKIKFRLDSGVSFKQLNLDSLRLFLYGDMKSSFTLYQYLCRYLVNIKVNPLSDADVTDTGQGFSLNADSVSPVGFSDDEALFPYPDNAFTGYRLLQDYFSFPHKYLFIDINGLKALACFDNTNEFEIVLEFNRRLDEFVRINDSSFLMNCTPIVNLFSMDADPVRLHHEKSEYNVRPSTPEQSHYEIYSINSVTGWKYGGREKIQYQAFASVDNSIDKRKSDYYQIRVKPSVVGQGADTYISFISSGNAETFDMQPSTVSLELTCTNRSLPEKLKAGDITVATGTSPEYTTFNNIFPATPSTPAPIKKDLHWQLISNMSLNYQSLADIKALRVILSTYNFQANFNRQAARAHELKMQGLVSINQEPCTMMIKGLPVRGNKTILDMKSEKFSSEGEMFLFTSVLSEFLSMYASINTFSQLVIRDQDMGEEYQWPIKTGQQV